MTKNETVRAALTLAVHANLPVLLWGAPGTGKTSAVNALARDLAMPVEVVVGSIREPSDFAGLPIVREDGTWLAPPRWASRLATAGTGLLFLDELTTAPPAVQAAMLRIVLERSVGDLHLPEEVRIVAAANPPEIAADGWELSTPLANRMIHLEWTIDAREVSDGFIHGFASPGSSGGIAPTTAQIAAARSQIGCFLRLRPELALAVPEIAGHAGRSWPSPRSWEMAAVGVAAGNANGADESVIAALVMGAVGEAAGFEALSWFRHLDLPTPEALLNDPSAPLPDRTDRLHVALSALAAHVVADAGSTSWEGAWQVIAKAASTTPDVAAAAARTLAEHRPADARLPSGILALAPFLRAAGIMP